MSDTTGHESQVTTLPEEITAAAATPIAWDHDLPPGGIVEHNTPEVVLSMVDETPGPAADSGQQQAAKPAKKAAAKKAPAKKAAAKKAAPKAAGT